MSSSPSPALRLGLDVALSALKAAAEPTRLRLLALLAEGELTVSDMTDILGQSQPRISRHLKLLVEAGLVERHREGAWAFFRLSDGAGHDASLRAALARLDPADPALRRDRDRLAEVRAAHQQAAARYFSANAERWDGVRGLHVSEAAVERAILAAVGDARIETALDLGTGTGRMLELLSPRVGRAIGVDANRDMLALARANLARAGVTNTQVRQGDIFAPPVETGAFDLVVVHQVLHFLDDPARAVREAARALRPGGRLLIVDFAPHGIEELRERHAHRRLGFSSEAMAGWLAASGLDLVAHSNLPPPDGDGDKLTVSLWLARDPRIVSDALPSSSNLEVA
ncbi:ArsR/SmtB family transcription factor [Methylopila sp. Yamaguchi]|uniref:ArsR/SmtB family transcription factor n=1 Tax=Methylopila sp. Yamaguchi TaxID=1437817 RepID=UPI000CBC9345|nr:metalloregulator ArsR/SmtB family transcription factor [Methylopila sp. Yamaguchi]GBD50100.1 ArsR family transcriptional regulator [Methylopila sp. Yamaguchi]